MKKYLIWIILIFALFLRTYRASDLTGFYYDQGRDAKVIWQLWHEGKMFLIGPTTGIEGIFLGPFYYYLIAPFYLLGGGNPVFPAVALALINCLGIYAVYLIGRDFFDDRTGLLAAFFLSFSHLFVESHRWLSNPTPLPLFAAVALYLLLKIISGTKHALVWLGLGLVLGISLQLEAASAVFFLPATLIILLIFRKPVSLHLIFTFCLTLIPQLWFNFRHDNLLLYSFKKFLVADKSFAPALFNFYPQRLAFYFQSFTEKFFPDHAYVVIFTFVFVCLAFLVRNKFFTRNFSVLSVWVLTPLTLLLFYHGNNGFVWDYYFTGIFPAFVLMVSWILTLAYRAGYWPNRTIVGLFILVFFITNLSHIYRDLSRPLTKTTDITLGTSLSAVDWVYQDAKGRNFNVDVYVPPVVPHSYDYLFLWRGKTRYFTLPASGRQDLLYLVYESDTPHPERLKDWLVRQAGYSDPVDLVTFGGVTVERRIRKTVL